MSTHKSAFRASSSMKTRGGARFLESIRLQGETRDSLLLLAIYRRVIILKLAWNNLSIKIYHRINRYVHFQCIYEKSRIHYLFPILLLIAYSVLGGFIFYTIESPNEEIIIKEKVSNWTFIVFFKSGMRTQYFYNASITEQLYWTREGGTAGSSARHTQSSPVS